MPLYDVTLTTKYTIEAIEAKKKEDALSIAKDLFKGDVKKHLSDSFIKIKRNRTASPADAYKPEEVVEEVKPQADEAK